MDIDSHLFDCSKINLGQYTDRELSRLEREIKRELKNRKPVKELDIEDIIEKCWNEYCNEPKWMSEDIFYNLCRKNARKILQHNKRKSPCRWEIPLYLVIGDAVRYMSSLWSTEGVKHRGPEYNEWYFDTFFNYLGVQVEKELYPRNPYRPDYLY